MENSIKLGVIQKLIEDPDVSEIMVNSCSKVFVERNGKKTDAGVKFSSDQEIFELIDRIFGSAGKRVDSDLPYGDICLSDGTRVNAIIPPLARFGPTLTFRKFSKAIAHLDDLIKSGTLTRRSADLLIGCVRGRVNMVFSGGTGVGKTTLLQMLSQYFSPDERIIVIEDAAELKFTQQNTVSLETRTPDKDNKGGVSIRDLIRNSLRMAPDRLVIGEVRGGEAIDMLQAMATGHSGTIGIVHGNSPKDVISRLETMVLMSGVELPLWEVRKLIASTINLIVHLERLQDGSRRVTYVTEIRGVEKDEILLNNLFVFHFEGMDDKGKIVGKLRPTIRYYPLFFQAFQKMGLLDKDIFVDG